VTGGGLYLFVTPDVSRPGNAASKLWRMPSEGKGHTNRVGPASFFLFSKRSTKTSFGLEQRK
jgi:hypothetical protein